MSMVQCNSVGGASVGGCRSSHVCTKFIATVPHPSHSYAMPRQADKEAAQGLQFREKIISFIGSSDHLSTIFVIEVLSWLTGEGPRPRTAA